MVSEASLQRLAEEICNAALVTGGFHIGKKCLGKKCQVLNPSNFGLIPLHITGFLILVIFSIYQNFES
jgi:hypothetical protein